MYILLEGDTHLCVTLAGANLGFLAAGDAATAPASGLATTATAPATSQLKPLASSKMHGSMGAAHTQSAGAPVLTPDLAGTGAQPFSKLGFTMLGAHQALPSLPPTNTNAEWVPLTQSCTFL